MVATLQTTKIAHNNGTDAATISADGLISSDKFFHGKSHPCFSYKRTSGHITTNVDITFNDKVVDTDNAFSTSTGIYTVPYAGVWEFNFSLMTNNNSSSGHFQVDLYHGTLFIYRTYGYKAASTHSRITGAGMLLDCAVGDEVKLRAANAATINLYGTGDRYTWFSGKLVG